MITKKYYKLVRVSYEDSGYFYIKNISDQTGNFSVTKYGSPTAQDMEYSTDGVIWTAYDFTNLPTIEVPAGGNIYLRGNNSSGFNRYESHYYKLSMDVNHNIGGNICSLINKTNPETVTSLPNCCFYYLFSGDTHIISAGNMNFGNVTSVGNNVFAFMFYGCTSLITAPDLSSVTSVGDGVFASMFYGCTSLTTAPDLSSVTSVGTWGCYQMFFNCTSLTTAPDLLSVTTINYYGCNTMFKGCRSLTTAPDLSNVTTVGSGGCNGMFDNCYNLSSATAPNISTWNTSNFDSWLNNAGTQATGTKTIYKPAALTIPTNSVNGVPTGWTVANY